MNRQAFYDEIRETLFAGKLTTEQVEGMEAILDEWFKRDLKDLRWLAYIFATAYHETSRTMQPIEEYGRGRGRAYGKPHAGTGKVYYGRGFCQLTWHYNYLRFEKILNEPLVNHPELALGLNTAAKILFIGMIEGIYTGKKLSDYLRADKEDFVNARRIVNGIDCALQIANHAKKFLSAIK